MTKGGRYEPAAHRPAACEGRDQRPGTRQHPTALFMPTEDFACIGGGVHTFLVKQPLRFCPPH